MNKQDLICLLQNEISKSYNVKFSKLFISKTVTYYIRSYFNYANKKTYKKFYEYLKINRSIPFLTGTRFVHLVDYCYFTSIGQKY